jgi:NAD dependent epimerase/dehydratase family
MAIMITGGTGFLGSYLTRHLAHEKRIMGKDLILFDRYPNKDRIADVLDQVADLFSQSKHCVRLRPVFRGKVEGTRSPACSVLLGQAHAIRSCADCDGMCRALPRPWPTTAHPERSKNKSAVRSVRSRRYAPSTSGGRSTWWCSESAQQTSSGRRSDTKPTV